jgi:CubicO group peptidase (beta-lactamase class C family)
LHDLEQSWLATPPADPGGHFEYSDLGYCILGMVVQALTGERWTVALTNFVLRPLQMQASIGDPLPAGLPTLGGNPNFGHFRKREWLALGLPDSGLVSSVSATLSLVKAFAGYAAEWRLALMQEATTPQTAELPAAGYARPPWGLGVQIRGDQDLHPVETWTPRGASPASFGHQGASGGLVWHDPQSHVSVAFFTSHDASRPNWQFAGRYLLGGRLLACAKVKEE